MLKTLTTIGTVHGGESCVQTFPKLKYADKVGGVAYVHGAGSDATYMLSTAGKQSQRTNKVSSVFNGISGDMGGAHTWGNQLSTDRLNGYITNLNNRLDSNGKYALIGDSMGGVIALNYAAGATKKPNAIVMVIPVINLGDIHQNNRDNYAPAINAAYGAGGYNEAGMGTNRNPYTMRNAEKLKGIPMLIFYGANDTLCRPEFTEGFAAADPTNRTLVKLPFGHEMPAYDNVDHNLILNFLKGKIR